MVRFCACILACLALLAFASCGSQAERNEARDDLRRFRQARATEVIRLKRDLERALGDQVSVASELPHDTAKFFAWRHREWLKLTDELAVLMECEWDAVEHLYDEVSRYYGYQVRNFPRLPEDVVRFCAHAEDEWVALLRDVAIFIEWRDREMLPLRRELVEAYERAGWEAGSFMIDLRTFLQWRDREWNRLVSEKDAFMRQEAELGRRMREDLRRFRAARALEGRYLLADLKGMWEYEAGALPPRLVADVCRWAMLPPQQVAHLRSDIDMIGENASEDALRLLDDVARISADQVAQVPLLVAEVDRFFDSYDREYVPLEADLKRWWRTNVGLGILLREDLRISLVEAHSEESAELQASMRRFVAYAGVEWRQFRASLGRFLHDDSGRAFGDRALPMMGDAGRAVFEDPRSAPARGYDAGEE